MLSARISIDAIPCRSSHGLYGGERKNESVADGIVYIKGDGKGVRMPDSSWSSANR